jgi:type I restriction enzyme M protein
VAQAYELPEAATADSHVSLVKPDAEKIAPLVLGFDLTNREREIELLDAWRGEKGAGDYADIKGFCKSVKLEDIRKYSHVLTPGTYVGTASRKADNEPFEEKMERLVSELSDQLGVSDTLTGKIQRNLGALGYEF